MAQEKHQPHSYYYSKMINQCYSCNSLKTVAIFDPHWTINMRVCCQRFKTYILFPWHLGITGREWASPSPREVCNRSSTSNQNGWRQACINTLCYSRELSRFFGDLLVDPTEYCHIYCGGFTILYFDTTWYNIKCQPTLSIPPRMLLHQSILL